MPPYSPSCTIDDKYVFISGQVALDPNSTEKVLVGAGDVSKEATQVLKNVSSLLKKSGASWDSALFVQIFLTDISNYGALNAANEEALRDCEEAPARILFCRKALAAWGIGRIECIVLKQKARA